MKKSARGSGNGRRFATAFSSRYLHSKNYSLMCCSFKLFSLSLFLLQKKMQNVELAPLAGLSQRTQVVINLFLKTVIELAVGLYKCFEGAGPLTLNHLYPFNLSPFQ
jgi:hypothetical protein